MDRKQTAVFIGHKECASLSPLLLRETIIDHIEHGVKIFLNGGMGNFDSLCAGMVNRLKKQFPEIKNELVIPYLSFAIHDPERYDAIVFPEELEGLYFKAAIPARNRYMVQQAGYAICYVNHDWGGAAQTLHMARKAGTMIINLGEYHVL